MRRLRRYLEEQESPMDLDDDTKWLEWVARQFESIAGEDKEIDLEEFKTALKVKESFFAERFFALFDSDGSSTISLEELLEALKLLVHGSETDKLRFLFQVYDVDGSGSVDPDELRTVLKSCLKESSISLSEEKLDDLTRALFESADSDSSGSITFEELREELQRFPEVMENLTISAASWLKPPTAPPKSHKLHCLSPAYWHNNKSKLLFLGSYTGVNLLLFTLAALKHAGSGVWILIAKGCGQCLNFNCTFVVVLMLRRCLTWLRATWVSRVLPLDQNVVLHQLVGYAIVGLTSVHTAAHVANFVRMSQMKDSYRFWEYLFTTRPGIGWISGTASITGLLLQTLICLMLLCSSSFVRRSGHFEVFYWTHLSYIFIWALLVIHGPNFWKWFVMPGFLFLLEKIFSVGLSRMGGLYIVEINLLPSKVTHLVIKRPQFFHYKPGDYVYLNIPVIAKYEWHPFTISSAPEQTGTIWLHIRSLGQWTNQLYEYFQHYRELPSHKPEWLAGRNPGKKKKLQQWVQKNLLGCPDLDPSVATNEDDMVEILSYTPIRHPGWEVGHLLEASPRCKEVNSQSRGGKMPGRPAENRRCCRIKCYIDGPYGTPTRRIFTSEHAVLIGAGIGITPFASILQSIMYRYRMRKQTFSKETSSGGENFKHEDMKLRKVDFIWINRDQTSFEWFVSLLTQLEINQADEDPDDRFLEMHLYMTSALGKNDMKAIGLQMALDLLAKKEQRDSITGLKTRTQPGRPDWNQLFQKLAKENKGKVHIFFCGSPALAKIIKDHCEQFNFRFFKEHF
ncbi:NADPH oxidase 5 isoform X6 [Hemicordylus capensis]|uniref:NADPH oxidase 5 isoform X6 n=1 Tax=Hemicordylus capensis TaxID=884348 RepID=UPI002302C57A|nr:NADPH oxidase 5 isoform X6 [Hemicordylus capensis]